MADIPDFLKEDVEKLSAIQKKQAEEAAQAKENNVRIIGFKTNKNGGIVANSIKNIRIILERDPEIKGLFTFNEFNQEVEVARDFKKLHIRTGDMKDDYIAGLLDFIETKYDVLFQEKLFNMALVNVAHENSHNPVKEYMDTCNEKWDGVMRVQSLLPDYLGVKKSKITTLQTKLFFVGAVAKVYKPRTKFDYVLDLVGGQGTGKTTFLKKMSNGWYTDQFTDFKDKDSYGLMFRALIINDDEMTATNNSDFENLKKFISSESLEYRKAYARHSERRDKGFVMARTTNELTYLKDKTGERRFLPNLVSKERQKISPIDDLSQEMIDQYWGEFVHYYKNGFSFRLTDEQESLLKEQRQHFMYIDAQEEAIEDVLANWHGDFITSADIASQMGTKELINDRQLAKKIKYVMDNRSDWRIGHKLVNSVSRRGYRRNK